MKKDQEILGADAAAVEEAGSIDSPNLTHAARLFKMAKFLNDLIEAARRFNGDQPNWESERRAEHVACWAGMKALNERDELIDALKCVVGYGYCELSGLGSQDYVSKKAILAVRRAIAKAEGR